MSNYLDYGCGYLFPDSDDGLEGYRRYFHLDLADMDSMDLLSEEERLEDVIAHLSCAPEWWSWLLGRLARVRDELSPREVAIAGHPFERARKWGWVQM